METDEGEKVMPFEALMKRVPSRRIGACLLIAALVVPAAPARAANGADLLEMSLESLMNVTVVGASRYEQKSSEAPSYVSVITANDIQRFGYRNLADLLRSVPGIFTTYDRNYSYIGVRGFAPTGDYNTRILLLVDGHRINNAVYDQALIGNEFPVDIDLVERVEIVRGPSSSLYGSNAFFGIVNVITKRGGTLQGAEMSGSAGSYRTFQGRATYGRDFLEGPEILFSGTASRGQGQDLLFPAFNDPATNNGVAAGADAEGFRNAFAKITWGDFTLEGVNGYRKKHVPTGSYETTFNDNRTYTVDRTGYLDLQYKRDLPGDLNVFGRLYYDDYRYYGDYIYDPEVNKDSGKGRMWGAEWKVVKAVRERQRLTAGAEYRNNFRQEQGNYDVGAPGPNLDDRHHSHVWAAYFQDEVRITPNLILSAGVRHDHHGKTSGTTNPRIGLIFRPQEDTSVKLLYGRAFRTPNAYESYYGDNGIALKPNPNLRSEIVQTYEAVLERYADGLGGRWKGTAAAFFYRIDDLVTAQVDPADGLTFFGNSDTIEAKGVEMELEGRMANGIEGRASYAWQQSEVRGTGAGLVNSPKSMVKVNLVLPLLPGKIFLSPEAQYLGPRKTLPGKASESVAGYTVVNATLFMRPPQKGLELSASVYNLFDKEFADPAGTEHLQDVIPQDGRNYRVKVTCRF
jgi:iron complex outermembrane receptor protein